MSMLSLSINVLQHHESKTSSQASDLTRFPTAEENLSAADRSLFCRSLCSSHEVDISPNEHAESHDRFLKPLVKERKARARGKFRNASPKKESRVKKPATADSAYESADDSSSLVPSDLQIPNSFCFTLPATVMIPRRVSIVEPESQTPETSVVVHATRTYPSLSPRKESLMKEPATPDTAIESAGDSTVFVPSDLQLPKFFTFTPPATVMIPRRVSFVEPHSQPPVSSIVLHPRRNYRNHSPKEKSPMKEPATPDNACGSLGVFPSLVPSGHQVPICFPFMPPATRIIPRRVSDVESESQPPEISILIHVDEETKPKPAQKERKYWNKIADGRLGHFGIVNLRTAEALMQLGSSHMRCEEYKEALTVFRNATRIFRRVNGSYDLSTAMALNKVGLASCRSSKLNANLRNAMDALNQSFSIRYELLGPTHVDTIDTLNNMAAVHLHLQEFQEARQAFFEVWTLREVIFGPKHPSVAVTAHCLGRVYMRLNEVAEASKYYHNALDIYRYLRLSEDNPTVARLLNDITSLGRG